MLWRRGSCAVVAAVVAFPLALGGCGLGSDGDDDNGGQQPPPQGIVFNSATMVEAAAGAAGVVDVFPGLTGILLEVFDPLLSGAGRASAGRIAAAVIPLGDLGLCTNEGASLLTWDDADSSLTLSAGDSATLAFTGCALDFPDEEMDGSVTIDFTTITMPDPPEVFPITAVGRLATAPSLVFTDLTDGSTETLTMDFGLQITQVPLEATLVYGSPTAMGLISFVDSEGSSVQFGCFDVTHVIPLPLPPTEYTLAPRGIVSVDGVIMQLGSYETATMDVPLDFTGLIPTSGTVTLLNFDARPAGPCTAVGSSGASPAVISAERITATGGGAVTIETFDDADLTPPPNDIDTTRSWTELLDL